MNAPRTGRILVVEDNPDLAFGLRNNLEIEGHEVRVAEDGPKGVDAALGWKPDLVILDLMLPGMDGYRVLRTIRDAGFEAPVLMLTARGEESDKVMGFRNGADDYVTKPFGVLELLARVIDHRESRNNNLVMMAGPVANAAEAEAITSQWAHVLRKAMDNAHAAAGGRK